jgi:hypothetical protein
MGNNATKPGHDEAKPDEPSVTVANPSKLGVHNPGATWTSPVHSWGEEALQHDIVAPVFDRPPLPAATDDVEGSDSGEEEALQHEFVEPVFDRPPLPAATDDVEGSDSGEEEALQHEFVEPVIDRHPLPAATDDVEGGGGGAGAAMSGGSAERAEAFMPHFPLQPGEMTPEETYLSQVRNIVREYAHTFLSLMKEPLNGFDPYIDNMSLAQYRDYILLINQFTRHNASQMGKLEDFKAVRDLFSSFGIPIDKDQVLDAKILGIKLQNVQDALCLGCWQYLSDPINTKNLLRAVEIVVGSRYSTVKLKRHFPTWTLEGIREQIHKHQPYCTKVKTILEFIMTEDFREAAAKLVQSKYGRSRELPTFDTCDNANLEALVLLLLNFDMTVLADLERRAPSISGSVARMGERTMSLMSAENHARLQSGEMRSLQHVEVFVPGSHRVQVFDPEVAIFHNRLWGHMDLQTNGLPERGIPGNPIKSYRDFGQRAINFHNTIENDAEKMIYLKGLRKMAKTLFRVDIIRNFERAYRCLYALYFLQDTWARGRGEERSYVGFPTRGHGKQVWDVKFEERPARDTDPATPAVISNIQIPKAPAQFTYDVYEIAPGHSDWTRPCMFQAVVNKTERVSRDDYDASTWRREDYYPRVSTGGSRHATRRHRGKRHPIGPYVYHEVV